MSKSKTGPPGLNYNPLNVNPPQVYVGIYFKQV